MITLKKNAAYAVQLRFYLFYLNTVILKRKPNSEFVCERLTLINFSKLFLIIIIDLNLIRI